jgi:hypothetical protein
MAKINGKGGARPGAGRPMGSKNKVTPEIKAMAQKHCPAALQIIVGLAKNADTESTRLAAAKEILDRGYGRARQAVTAEINHSSNDGVMDLLAAIGTHPSNTIRQN